ncbi:uncharacterized protein At5g39570-like [Chenopodium quinoa]|uniref:uncharacterized protein At5g39570-like n=1 Tax=Chenopodium quinoa TaxID=63459 RepID=UPI000B78AF7D|nr:uncharacterized protein At5g39570-like [Chenopodium quinoa]
MSKLQALTPSLVGYYYSNYNQPESVLTKDASLSESGEYYDHVTTHYAVFYNNNNTAAEAEEGTDAVSFDEKDWNPKPFHGGYDINEKYGKPLPPSEEICYPSSKPDSNNAQTLGDFSYGAVPSPYVNGVKNDVGGEDEEEEEEGLGEKQDGLVAKEGVNEAEPKQSDVIIPSKVIQEEKTPVFEEEKGKGGEKKDEVSKEPSEIGPIVPLIDASHAKEAQDVESDAKPKDGSIVSEAIQEEKALDFEEGFEEEVEEEIEGGVVGDEGSKEEYGDQIRRQIPPGYGMEAIDLCEGVFGGYFPCLWKRNQRIYNHQRDGNDNMNDYDYCWKETAEYLFGNPNPYGGTMPEKGSYGDPVYSYHRHFPQQPLTEQVQYHGGNSS